VSGWIALTTSGGLLASQLISGLILLFHPDFTLKPYQVWLIYVAWTLIAFCINAFANRLLPYFNRGAFIWSIGGFTIVCITVLACASPNYTSAEYVFTDFINETGWPDGVAWLLGLLQGGFGITGYDAVAHMIEEIPNASVEGPKIMIYCVMIGTVTGFLFLMVLLFVSGGDSKAIIGSASGPLLQILYNATSSRAGAVCLLMFPLGCILFAEVAISKFLMYEKHIGYLLTICPAVTTSSRMTYAFARDRGLPWSNFFAKVHPRLGQPLNALMLAAGLTILFGLILIGSSSAFNALISASVVALGVSYAIPIAINVCRGRKMLPPRAFALPNVVGWAANLLGLAYTTVTTVLFLFPPELPVTTTNMSMHLFDVIIEHLLILLDYCVVAFGIILFISTFQWFIDGRKNFTGPSNDMGMEVLEAMKSAEPKDEEPQHVKVAGEELGPHTVQ
jgi:choline transport protein